MDLKILYIEIYVASLMAIMFYVVVELLKVENEKNVPQQGGESRVGRSPAWYLLAGRVAVSMGVLAFCISAAVGYIVYFVTNSSDARVPLVILITGFLNPIFLLGVPLGFLWLGRGKRLRSPSGKKSR